MVLGVDPSWVLDQPLEDMLVVEKILEAASKLRVEYDEQLAKAIGAETAHRVVQPLAKHLTRLVAALQRSQRRRT